MIRLPQYKNKKIGVFGLGLSGRATVASLCASGAEVYAWDEGKENLAKCQAQHRDAVYTDFRKWPWKGIETLILSPGVPLHYPQPHPIVGVASVYGCEITGDVELLMQSQSMAKYVGITGTNGKSTTTALVGHLLESVGAQVQVGGNIGKPALSLEPLGVNGVYVIEMSSYQIDLMLRSTFNIAVLLNITPDHLDRHGGMKGYVKAKKRIFDGMGTQDTAIISVEDEYSSQVLRDLRGGKNLYSWQQPKLQFVELSTENKCPINLSKIATLQGQHNKQNAVAAIAVCETLGHHWNQLKDGFKSFSGLVHRMQPVVTQGNIQFVNDSKATNAEATAKALGTYEDIYWILGGVAKEGGIDALHEYFPRIKKAYVIGEAADGFAKVLGEHRVDYQKSNTLEKATMQASTDALAARKGVVLLSPACASFDQFPNFEQRGEHFITQVKKNLEAVAKESDSKGDAA